MTTIGIEKISFYTPRTFLDMKDLANANNIEVEKYTDGLGQEKMGVLHPSEDVVTMGAEAVNNFLDSKDKEAIDLLIFATESSVDQSKSAGIYIHKLLGLNSKCRNIELKQACYSSTAGLRMALNYVQCNPEKKALLIASDNARYGIKTPGEVTQGACAVAMLISVNAKIATFDNKASFATKDEMDFWRPNHRSEALVNGKYSTKLYLTTLVELWKEYKKDFNRSFSDHYKFCYHLPFAKMVKKAHKEICILEEKEHDNSYFESTYYNTQIGNCYTASLYLSLISMLDNIEEDLSGKKIGIYAYGSGCVAEILSCDIMPNYKNYIFEKKHKEIINSRQKLDYSQYNYFYRFQEKLNVENINIEENKELNFNFIGIKNNKRIYKRNE